MYADFIEALFCRTQNNMATAQNLLVVLHLMAKANKTLQTDRHEKCHGYGL
jgi:hypothetical protein